MTEFAAKRITSFGITWCDWSLHCIEDIDKHITTISRNKCVIRQLMFNEVSKEPLSIYEYMVSRNQCEGFFSFLRDVALVDEWQNDYSVLVCDGWSWESKIRYSNNTIKKVNGTVKPPPFGNDIAERILAMAEYVEIPLLFS